MTAREGRDILEILDLVNDYTATHDVLTLKSVLRRLVLALRPEVQSSTAVDDNGTDEAK